MDVKSAEKQINALIDKRASGREAANREEESFLDFTRKRRRQVRLENGYAWAEHLQGKIRRHNAIAVRAARKLDAVLEEIEEIERSMGRREVKHAEET